MNTADLILEVEQVWRDVEYDRENEFNEGMEDIFFSLENVIGHLITEANDFFAEIFAEKLLKCGSIEKQEEVRRKMVAVRNMSNPAVVSQIINFIDQESDMKSFTKAFNIAGEDCDALGEYAHQLVGLVDVLPNSDMFEYKTDKQKRFWDMHGDAIVETAHLAYHKRNAVNARLADLKLVPRDLNEYAIQIIDECDRLKATWMSKDMARRILGEGRIISFWSVNRTNFGMMPAWEVVAFGIATRGLTWFEDYMAAQVIKTGNWLHTDDMWSDGVSGFPFELPTFGTSKIHKWSVDPIIKKLETLMMASR
jgi:hypothetical protein